MSDTFDAWATVLVVMVGTMSLANWIIQGLGL